MPNLLKPNRILYKQSKTLSDPCTGRTSLDNRTRFYRETVIKHRSVLNSSQRSSNECSKLHRMQYQDSFYLNDLVMTKQRNCIIYITFNLILNVKSTITSCHDIFISSPDLKHDKFVRHFSSTYLLIIKFKSTRLPNLNVLSANHPPPFFPLYAVPYL